MRISQQTPTLLTVKTGKRKRLFALGLFLLVAGLLIVSLLRIRPLSGTDLRPPRLIFQQEQTLEPESEIGKDATFRFAYQITKQTTSGLRPIIFLGVLGLIAGLTILLGPNRSDTVIFDKANKRLTLKQPRWFFRSEIETYPFEDIAEVRVERDRSSGTNNMNNYGVNLVLSHSQGTPLTNNYIHYKTVFPLSQSYRQDYQSSQTMVDTILNFIQ